MPPGVKCETVWDAVKPENPKEQAGRAKPPLCLIPPGFKIELAKVMEAGAAKYGRYNWRDAGIQYTTYISAADRHLSAMLDGEDIDPESGLPHAAHVAACMAIIRDAHHQGMLKDDRPKSNHSAADLIRAYSAQPPKS